MRNILLLLFTFFISTGCNFAQGLENICALRLQQTDTISDISFLLTLTDYSLLRKDPARFTNSIQIVDATQPWPPRWFAAWAPDTALSPPYSLVMPLNASLQNGTFSYFSEVLVNNKDKGKQNRQGFMICNENLEITDTFILPDENIDHHEFVIAKNNEKLFFVLHDTIVDQSNVYNSITESALHISYEIIEIADSSGYINFRWDPFLQLGPDAEYKNYRKSKSSWNRPGMTDWGHGNSLSFDFDGDILYSYRSIGIGKISRRDGHVIWKIDREEMQPNNYSDTIPCYMQHDLRAQKDTSGQVYYSFFSNGDGSLKTCSVIQFTVKDTTNGQYKFTLRKKTVLLKKPVYSAGQGNFEIENDGHYIINYGGIKGDTTQNICFEYRAASDSIIGRYTAVFPYAPAYRVHQLDGWRPERPIVTKSHGKLNIQKQVTDVVWYRLDYNRLIAVKAGTGKTFNPDGPGLYCATVKLGIGYIVSKPVYYTR